VPLVVSEHLLLLGVLVAVVVLLRLLLRLRLLLALVHRRNQRPPYRR
jgi:hypothetical protein